jgi:O-acetyl-ADP-ribose deacetylase (regulator of RNase III)
MTMELRTGDILKAREDYIVQQCCCTMCKPHGLSEAIAKAFPHGNVYASRTPLKSGGNLAREECRGKPGTSVILEGKPNIACLFGQYAPGRPGSYPSFGVPDTAAARLSYFGSALEDLATKIPEGSSLAFPFKIGCGLAGGNWKEYEQVLDGWRARHDSLRVVLYRLP